LKYNLGYRSKLGTNYVGDSLALLESIVDESVDMVLTSPPFPLERSKAYGNESKADYLDWLRPFTEQVWRILRPTGSFVIELGSSWMPNSPTKSTYQYDFLTEVTSRDDQRFHLAQEFFWHNPARLPSPAQWVTVERIRPKDSVSVIWWLSKSERPNADNRKILKPYSKHMERLFKNGYNSGSRPSEHVIGDESFSTPHAGSISSNFLPIDQLVDHDGEIPGNAVVVSNTSSKSRYFALCKRYNVKPHPARFPNEIPEYFLRFLTRPGDLVVDPFSGSNSVGFMAESLGRNWISCDLIADYVYASRYRFEPTPKASELLRGRRT